MTLTVLETETEVLSTSYDLCPVPNPIAGMALSGEFTYQGTEHVRDAQAYASAKFSPAVSAELVSTGFVRSQRSGQTHFSEYWLQRLSLVPCHGTRELRR